MSTSDTGRLTRCALIAQGLRIAELPVLSDVDIWESALTVAQAVPGSRFAAAVASVRDALVTPVPGASIAGVAAAAGLGAPGLPGVLAESVLP
jgi:hypothetical protein